MQLVDARTLAYTAFARVSLAVAQVERVRWKWIAGPAIHCLSGEWTFVQKARPKGMSVRKSCSCQGGREKQIVKKLVQPSNGTSLPHATASWAANVAKVTFHRSVGGISGSPPRPARWMNAAVSAS